MKKIKNTYLTRIGLLIGAIALIISVPVFALADINSNLKLGSRGSDVSSLQTFLGVGVDGVFGPVTKAAVIRYQLANGLTPDGIVGPLTRSVLNSQMSMGSSFEKAPIISGVYINPSRNSAIVNWTTDELSKGVVYYSNTPFSMYEHENSVDVSGFTAMTDTNARTSQSVSITNLQPNTTYYYLIYVTDQSGLVSVTWPTTFTTTN